MTIHYDPLMTGICLCVRMREPGKGRLSAAQLDNVDCKECFERGVLYSEMLTDLPEYGIRRILAYLQEALQSVSDAYLAQDLRDLKRYFEKGDVKFSLPENAQDTAQEGD